MKANLGLGLAIVASLAGCTVDVAAPEAEAISSSSAALALDPTFENDGKVVTGFWSSAKPIAHAVRADHKVVYAARRGSTFLIGLVTEAGETDEEWSPDGKPRSLNDLTGLDIKSIGSIVAVGNKTVVVGSAETTNGIVPLILRLHADGSLDRRFHNVFGLLRGGYHLVDAPGGEWDVKFESVALDGKGRFVAAGMGSFLDGGHMTTRLVLARFESDGDLDTTFSSDGFVKQVVTFLDEEPMPEGIVVAVGAGREDIVVSNAAGAEIFHYFESGERDMQFGLSGGRFYYEQQFSSIDITVAADGRIFMVLGDRRDWEFVLAALEANGKPNRGFGVQGMTLVPFDTFATEQGRHLKFHDGLDRLYVYGDGFLSIDDWRDELALAAVRPDGLFDTSFHGDGKVVTNFSSSQHEWARGIALDGERLVGLAEPGFGGGESAPGVFLARYTMAVGSKGAPCRPPNRTCNSGLSCRSVTQGTPSGVPAHDPYRVCSD